MAQIIPQGRRGECLVPGTRQADEERGWTGGGSWLFKRTSLQMLEIPSYSEGRKAVLHTQLPRRALTAENSGHIKKSPVN